MDGPRIEEDEASRGESDPDERQVVHGARSAQGSTGQSVRMPSTGVGDSACRGRARRPTVVPRLDVEAHTMHRAVLSGALMKGLVMPVFSVDT